MTGQTRRRVAQRNSVLSNVPERSTQDSKSNTLGRKDINTSRPIKHSNIDALTTNVHSDDADNAFSSSEESTGSGPPSPISDFGDFESIDKPAIEGLPDPEHQLISDVSARTNPVQHFEHLHVASEEEQVDSNPDQNTGESNEMDVDPSANTQTITTESQMVNEPEQINTEHESAPLSNYFPVPIPQNTSTGIIPDAFATERPLSYTSGLMLATYCPHVAVVTLEKSFPKEGDHELKRIRMLSAFKGNSKIRNLALCDPASLSLVDKRYLKHTSSDRISLFFLTGIVKFASFFDDSQNSRQLGFLPIASTWYRTSAVLGEVYGTPKVHFTSFQGAITISTKTRNASSSTSSQPEGLSAFDNDNPTLSLSEIWALNFDARVPVFDGRHRLNFNNLRECPKYCRELQPGSAVAPIFSVHSYHPYGAQLSKHNIQKTDTIISFNIRALIYVKEPHSAFTHLQKVNARQEALGVIWPAVRADYTESHVSHKAEEDDDLLGGSPMDTSSAII